MSCKHSWPYVSRFVSSFADIISLMKFQKVSYDVTHGATITNTKAYTKGKVQHTLIADVHVSQWPKINKSRYIEIELLMINVNIPSFIMYVCCQVFNQSL